MAWFCSAVDTRAFCDEGADVTLTDIDASSWHATADDIGATFAPLDVASEADWDAVDERFPALDVLVHHAGSPGWRS